MYDFQFTLVDPNESGVNRYPKVIVEASNIYVASAVLKDVYGQYEVLSVKKLGKVC